MLGLIKVIVAAFVALLLWWALSGATLIPSASPQEPPRPPEPIPAQASAVDVAKLNDTITKLTAAVDRLNQKLDPSAPASTPKPQAKPAREDVYGRQTWRRPWGRDPGCWW